MRDDPARVKAILWQVARFATDMLDAPDRQCRAEQEEALIRALTDLDGAAPGWIHTARRLGTAARRQGKRR